MKVIAGEIEADEGDVWRQPGTRAIYLRQEPDLSGYKTLADFAVADLPAISADDRHLAEAELMALVWTRKPIRQSFQAGRSAVRPWHALSRLIPIFYCSTSRPTTLIFRRLSNSKGVWRAIAARF